MFHQVDVEGPARKKTAGRNREELGRFAQRDRGPLPLGVYLKKKPSSGSDDGLGYSPFFMPSSEPQRADKDESNGNNKYEYFRESPRMNDESIELARK
jgi:hypothetical protein